MLGGVFYFKPKLFGIMKEYNDEVEIADWNLE